jgi:methionyl-tRNA formyltransferase
LIDTAWRIVFFGTPSFSTPALERLLQDGEKVIAVVTQPDREKGRGRKIVPSAVKELALSHSLLLLQPERIKDGAFSDALKALAPDLFVVIAYGRILPKSVLDIPMHGAVNVHASLLPQYRGASPVSWAILRGETKTGVTTMLLDEGMDTGDILHQREVSIGVEDNAETLHDRLSAAGAELLAETIAGMKAGTVRPLPQDASKASYAPLLDKEDGRIDWTESAIEVDRRVRAFTPWPGAFTTWENRLMKIISGKSRQGEAGAEPGRVVWAGSDFVEVATGSGLYRIEEIQVEGKRRMTVREFLSGHSLRPGAVLR